MEFKYVMAYSGENLLACFYFQLLPFNAADRLQLKPTPKDGLNACFYKQIKRLIASRIDFTTLICGNLLATGPYGFSYRKEVSILDLQEILDQLLNALFNEPDLIHRASVFLIKELPASKQFQLDDEFPLKGLHPFYIQPSMFVYLMDKWKSFEDYLSDLQSKYRLRIRRAIDAAHQLHHRELTSEEVHQHKEVIFELYRNTADNADFNLVQLNPDYFPALKVALPDRYRVFGFFQGDQMVAFYSFLKDGDELLGHFIGTSSLAHSSNQLYMNILIQFVRHGIEGRFKRINLARTALEIKSSVGAQAENMACYIQHRNRLYNKVVPNLLEYLKPQQQFTLRTPFKESTLS